MKKTVAWFADNHVAANLLMLFLLLAGAVTGLTMKLEVFPEASLDRINVSVAYSGASPAEVAQQIFAALYGKITSPNVMGTLNDQLKKLGGVGVETIEKATKEGLKGATDVVKGIEKDAGSVTDKVKGLFEKKD